MKWISFISIVVMTFTLASANTDFAFPDEENNSDVLNANGPQQPSERLPIDIPGRCPPNMLLYPGDGSTSEWICDCKKGFLYFPLNETCHEAYRQGPCSPEHYVVLPLGEVVPKCERNPCLKDGLVPFNDTCTQIKSTPAPCPVGQIVAVNEKFQLQCEILDIVQNHIIDAPANRCPSGSRRNALGQCRQMI